MSWIEPEAGGFVLPEPAKSILSYRSRNEVLVGTDTCILSVNDAIHLAHKRHPTGSSSATSVLCLVPPPSSYRSAILQSSVIHSHGFGAAVLLPLSPATLMSHAWRHDRDDLQRLLYRCLGGSQAGETPFFGAATQDISSQAPLSSPLSLETSPSLHLWVATPPRPSPLDLESSSSLL